MDYILFDENSPALPLTALCARPSRKFDSELREELQNQAPSFGQSSDLSAESNGRRVAVEFFGNTEISKVINKPDVLSNLQLAYVYVNVTDHQVQYVT